MTFDDFDTLVLDLLDVLEDHGYPAVTASDVRVIAADDPGAAFTILLIDLPKVGVKLPADLWRRVRSELDDPDNAGEFSDDAPAAIAFQEDATRAA